MEKLGVVRAAGLSLLGPRAEGPCVCPDAAVFRPSRRHGLPLHSRPVSTPVQMFLDSPGGTDGLFLEGPCSRRSRCFRLCLH